MQKRPVSKPKQTQAELRKQLAMASKKLEDLQREQRIEAALDSVRTRALAMHESSELREVVAVLYQKLQELDFGIDKGAALVMTFSPKSKDHTQWITDAKQSYAIPFFIPYTNHSIARDQIIARRKRQSFLSKVYKEKEKNEYFKYLFKQTEYKHIPKDVQKLILKSKRFGISIAFEKHSAVAIPSTIGNLVKGDQKIILKRFSKVFEQCYTRFLDLQKAEAQAREAQIESALEKIRSRSLAMHHSDELRDVIGVTYKILGELNVKCDTIAYQVFDFDSKSSVFWPGNNLQDAALKVMLPYDEAIMKEDTCHRDLWKAMASGKDIINKVYTKAQKDRWFKYVFAHNDVQVIHENARQHILQSEIHTVCFFPGKNSGVFADSWDGSKYTDSDITVLKRVGKVFEQAYTRFLDLQKAEAQAREAQIEAALEKVRSRSMGMQRVDDMRSVIKEVYEQLKFLGFKSGVAAINIMDEATGDMDVWMDGLDDGYDLPERYHVPYFDHPTHNQHLENWRQGLPYGEFDISGAEKKSYDSHFFFESDFAKAPEHSKNLMMSQESLTSSMAYMKYGAIGWAPSVINNEQAAVLQRFAKVFEQTYTRFLDLQKAEAQAREAQIEAALEKIRSRSLAMHHSGELRDVIAVFFEKLIELGTLLGTVGIGLYDQKSKDISCWVGNAIQDPQLVVAPFDEAIMKEENFISQSWKAMTEKTELVNVVYSREQKDRYFNHLFAHNNQAQIPESAREILRKMEKHTVCFIPNQYSSLFVDSWDGKQYSDEDITILRRAGKVFEQAYVRFLDLQKAEAQAREAQIQLALERLRARTMAMHHSAELAEAAAIMFEQLSQLGASLWICGFNICKQDSEIVESWISPPGGKKIDPLYIPYTAEEFTVKAYLAWKNQSSLYTDIMEGKVLQQEHEELLQHPSMEQARTYIQENKIAMPTWVQRFAVPYTYGYMTIVTTKPFSETDILNRFARVFDQTYTRFLDLQKAEAQARESQIEAALEKVRSTSLAMHQSEELGKVVAVLFERLSDLGVSFDAALIYVFDDATQNIQLWVRGKDVECLLLPYNDFAKQSEIIQDFWRSVKSGADMINRVYTGKAKNEYLQYTFDNNDAIEVHHELRQLMFAAERWVVTLAPGKNFLLGVDSWTGELTSENNFQILKRFSKVFDQAYTRFLDLQKAEAQAREAQIEAALERVRAKSMAMQHSNELAGAAQLLYQQFHALGIQTYTCAYMFVEEEKNNQRGWAVAANGSLLPDVFDFPLSGDWVLDQRYQSWKSKQAIHEVSLQGEANKRHHEFIVSLQPPEFAQQIVNHFPDQVFFYNANFSHGYLFIVNTVPLTVDEKEIAIRFAKVFEQTYTRFLDLQKAEAQAREAEIQLALERARARTMAMQKSEDLKEVVKVMYEQLRGLGFQWGAAAIIIMDSAMGDLDWWMEGFADGYELPECYHVPYFEHQGHKQQLEHWKNGSAFAVIKVSGHEKKAYDQYYFNQTDFANAPENTKQLMMQQETVLFSMAYMKYGALSWSPTPLSDEQSKILQRFAQVFEQTYTRFLDLQKAEAQAREAQIEAALERIRSSAMAMHSSEGILDVTQVLREQIAMLGEKELESILIHIYHEDSDQFEAWYSYRHPENTEKQIRNGKQLLSWSRTARARKDKEKYHEEASDYTLVADYKMLKEWYEYLLDVIPEVVEVNADGQPLVPDVLYYNYSKIAGGTLLLITNSEASEHSKYLLRRAAIVFNLAYSRFLDLQKAEAQAREAQIEAALERVRSRSLAMHKSEEVEEVILVVSEQLQQLQFKFHNVSFGFDTEQMGLNFWLASPGLPKPFLINVPYIDNPAFNRPMQARNNGVDFNADILSREENIQFLQHMFDNSELSHIPAETKSFLLDTPGFARSQCLMKNTILTIGNYALSPYSEEQNAILRRFGNVFEQAYVRFLDLQKAEAQARESQIQLALERVRAKTMAMQSSNDLLGVANVLREQMGNLGQPELESSIVHLYNDTSPLLEAWYAFRPPNLASREIITGVGIVPKDCSAWSREVMAKYNSSETEYTIVASGEKLIEWYKILEHYVNVTVDYDEKGQLVVPEILYYHFSKFSGGALLMISNQEPSAEARELQRRAAVVFDLAYTRFLDLKKAEAQAREAKVETSLERVRSRSLAMHNSSELSELVATLFDELIKLDLVLARCIIWILHEDGSARLWMANSENKQLANSYHINRINHSYYNSIVKGWKERSELWVYELKDAEKASIDQILLFETELRQLPEEVKQGILTSTQTYVSGAFNKFGLIEASGPVHHTEEQLQILHRFNKVFEQSYTRFLDLQKAEAQAREAQIEASLERVRSKTMAMHNSEDVGETVATLFDELMKLGVEKTVRCGIIIVEDTKQMEVWTAADKNGKVELIIGHLDMNVHALLLGAFDAWKNKQAVFSYELVGNDLKDYFRVINNSPDYPLQVELDSLPIKMTNTEFYFGEGAIFTFTLEPIPDESVQIFKRFAGVFGQTYRRYLDLQKAEAQAREAVKQSTLDRVRGEIASMRTTADLDRITPLIWKELTTLGIPFIRCGVFIMDEHENKVHTYLSTPKGEAIAAYHISMKDSGNLAGAIDHWRAQKVFVTHWVETDFQAQADLLLKQGSITSREQYLNSIPKEGFHLHFLPFRQGMLYVGSNEQLQTDALQLVQSLADAFSVAYARYEDFTRLESAKAQIEKTLTDLKQTQAQLVQSEKMASLGELTAGIAHEIQNPLNFVNNFSEVNTELIEELKKELAVGNRQLAEEIADDVKANSEKINHHGQRAADIVKGMLQHSRSSSGVKEPTDINALADEYLRLAYHGLRAKDKSFNAKFEMHADPDLPKVNVLPQDVGRVILNLINNAFYAVTEKLKSESLKQKAESPAYELTVTVTTKNLGDSIEIRIRDNGTGIPEKVKEKIFQPFFTTKPTGQGTGLGLSLSYDIITKGHGGEIKIETIEGEGSEFIISLPIV